jgi:hypothetical protein
LTRAWTAMASPVMPARATPTARRLTVSTYRCPDPPIGPRTPTMSAVILATSSGRGVGTGVTRRKVLAPPTAPAPADVRRGAGHRRKET